MRPLFVIRFSCVLFVLTFVAEYTRFESSDVRIAYTLKAIGDVQQEPIILQKSDVVAHQVNAYGMGSLLNQINLARLEADFFGKELVLDIHKFIYNCSSINSWGCYFEPPTAFEVNTTGLVYSFGPTSRIRRELWWYDVMENKTALETIATNLNLPKELHHEALAISRASFARVFRLSDEMKEIAEETWNDLNVNHPCVGIHMRRGGCKAEQCFPAEEYIKVVESIDTKFSTVVVITDNKITVDELQGLRPEWNVKSPVRDFETGFARPKDTLPVGNYSGLYEYGSRILSDLYIGTKCEYFVAACTSNVPKVIQNVRTQRYSTCLCVDNRTGINFCQAGKWKAEYNDNIIDQKRDHFTFVKPNITEVIAAKTKEKELRRRANRLPSATTLNSTAENPELASNFTMSRKKRSELIQSGWNSSSSSLIRRPEKQKQKQKRNKNRWR